MKIAVAGASGFVGKYLIQSLLEQGHEVVALSRSERKEKSVEGITWKVCDLFSRLQISSSLEGCDVAFYLVHSMLPSARLTQGNFADYDLVLADNFARAARERKLKQIIYLGGIIPEDYALSTHLLSRQEVERTLRESGVPLTSLRAGIVLGPAGSSFTLMLNLVNRLPAMICPYWTGTLSNPVSVWDMTKALVYCIGNEETYNEYYDIGGRTTLSYLDMMKLLAKKLKKKRFFINIPFFSPTLSRFWVSLITGAPRDLVYPLVESLKSHMVLNVKHLLLIPNHRWMSFEESIDRILSETTELNQKPNAYKYTGNVKGNEVRSIKRLETLYRFNASEVAQLYFEWLPKFYSPFIKVETIGNQTSFKLFGFKTPILVLEFSPQNSTEAHQIYYIKKGLLAVGNERGRLSFRSIIDQRCTMAEIHQFIPRLPWFIYKYTQALIHLYTIKSFNRYLLKIRKKDLIE